MRAHPPSLPELAEPRLPLSDEPDAAAQWAALADAAQAVALIAGGPAPEPGAAAALIAAASPWRRAAAAPHLADLSAIMQHGLAALLAVRARGRDPRPAAGALLYEFGVAEEALCGVLAPPS